MLRGTVIRWLFVGLAVLLLVTSVVAPVLGFAEDPAPACSTPRDAADSLFVAPSPELSCVATQPQERARRAMQLRQILDARGLFVPVASLSQDPEFTPPEGGDSVQLLPGLAPWLSLQKQPDGTWAYSRSTMAQVPDLYAQSFSSMSLWFQSVLPSPFQQEVPVLGGYGWQWLYGAALIVVAMLSGLVVRLFVLAQLRGALGRLDLRVSEKLLRRLDTPVMVFVIAGLIAWRLTDVQLPIEASRTAYLMVSVLLGLSGVLIASRLVDIGAGMWASHTENTESKLDDQLVPLVRQVSQALVWAVGILFVLQNNGVQVWSFVAGLGIGSLAFALAAQDTVANLFGALNIFLDKPFQIGDWVRVGDVEGVIEEVGFRSFRVRTFYNSLVTVPNSTITNTSVDNLGVRPRRRVKIVLGLTYDTPTERMQAFVEGVRAILAAHPKVEQTYEVHFNDFSASSLDILVYYHIISDSWTEELETRAANFLEFIRLAEALDVSFAYPSQSIYVESTPERPAAKPTSGDLKDLEATAASFGPGGTAARPDGPHFDRSFAPKALTSRGEG